MKKTLLSLLLLISLYKIDFAQSKDLNIIKQRIVTELLQNKPYDKQVETILAKMIEAKKTATTDSEKQAQQFLLLMVTIS